MADNTKHLKNAINAKRQEIAQEEAQRAEWADSVGSRAPQDKTMAVLTFSSSPRLKNCRSSRVNLRI
ncbi:hypothetical protein P3342_000317 [Pyrenophora teres f. teres]|nr:hypothetical protein P3342_000317 [Pyrenophora teres f. teres]